MCRLRREREWLHQSVSYIYATRYGGGATSKNKLKIGVLQGVGQYPPNFHVEGDVPNNHLYTDR